MPAALAAKTSRRGGTDRPRAAGGATEPASAGSGWAALRPRVTVAVVIAVYLGLGVLANLPVWMGGVTHTMPCGGGSCGDPGQEVWFLAWAAHALTHLQDPLRTNWINYPFGVDLADNTSMPLAGVLGSPLTWLFGPVATYNVLFSLGFAGSATAAFFLLRRFTTRNLAAFTGGLLYGFSPYMIGEGNGHLFLLLVPVPPLLLLVLHEILVRQRMRLWLVGAAFGLLMIVQLGWSAEILADTLTLGLIGVLVLVVARPRLVRERFAYAAKAIVLGFAVLAPFALWMAVVSRSGAEHLMRPNHGVSVLAGLSTDLAGLVVPTQNEHFSFGLALTGNSFVGPTPPRGLIPDPAENGSYLGIPILLLLAVGALRFRRDGLVRFSVVMAGSALVLSMGSHLRVWGHETGVPLPFIVFTKLPFLQAEVASRYSLLVWLFVAVAVAVILDRACQAQLRRPKVDAQGGPSRQPRHGPLPLVLSLTVLGVASLVPGWPYKNIAPVVTPAALHPPTVDAAAVGSTLLTYPLASSRDVLPMVWQAIDRFEYRIPAGEAAVRDEHSGAVYAAFQGCSLHPDETVPSRRLVRAARREFARWQVRTVVIPETASSDPASANPSCAVRFVAEVLRRAPTVERGAAVWSNVRVSST